MPTQTTTDNFDISVNPQNIATINGLSTLGGNLTEIVFPARYINPNPPAGAPSEVPINTISLGAFSENKKIESVDFSESLIRGIGPNAFSYCENLESLTLSSNIRNIGTNSFTECVNLTSVDFPASNNNVTILGGAFLGNSKLESFDIYKLTGTVTIANDAFVLDSETVLGRTMNVYLNNSQSRYNDINGPFRNASYSYTCFLEGTLILTPSGYKPIESLKKGDLVRTLKGDKPIDSLITQHMYHDASEERNSKQLFSLHYPSVFQPLIVTGGHSTLVTPTPKELEAITTIFKVPEPVDGFYRLPAYVDEKASVYEVSGKYNIYHIVIGSTFEGIFANGLLVESCVL